MKLGEFISTYDVIRHDFFSIDDFFCGSREYIMTADWYDSFKERIIKRWSVAVDNDYPVVCLELEDESNPANV